MSRQSETRIVKWHVNVRRTVPYRVGFVGRGSGKAKVNEAGRQKVQSRIPTSRSSTQGYILTCSWLRRENLWQVWIYSKLNLLLLLLLLLLRLLLLLLFLLLLLLLCFVFLFCFCVCFFFGGGGGGCRSTSPSDLAVARKRRRKTLRCARLSFCPV